MGDAAKRIAGRPHALTQAREVGEAGIGEIEHAAARPDTFEDLAGIHVGSAVGSNPRTMSRNISAELAKAV